MKKFCILSLVNMFYFKFLIDKLLIIIGYIFFLIVWDIKGVYLILYFLFVCFMVYML